MKSTLLLFMTCIYCTGLAAAEVTVTACASATVTQMKIRLLPGDENPGDDRAIREWIGQKVYQLPGWN